MNDDTRTNIAEDLEAWVAETKDRYHVTVEELIDMMSELAAWYAEQH